ncbi:MBL fold metallo-hydrolase [Clostridium chromiireducens]|uniref:MBL fold metallo-hydrolase n=1 Tax=Clostridium chromiireducens TaxID=225345 RepID=A0A399ITV3_9CLOT|nr:MBL fold metallo-hydrolase [Clostridium chromiireducens]RII36463.1 MBL fold metallo-hydrolase [Clostridium chromiireducens]
MNSTHFFVKEIGKKTYLIDDKGNATAYLVIGRTKALLIDTGTGVNDLLSFVKTFTKLPLIVVNTHGHSDHVWGNYQFEEAYISMADKDLYYEAYSVDERRNFIDMFKYMIPQEVTSEEIENWIHINPCEVLSINHGDRVDIGERVLEVIELPGHTKGSIVLLDEKEKILFSGDSIIGRLWMHLSESTSLEVYLNSMKRLRRYCNKFEKIYCGHTKYNEEGFEVKFINEIITDVSKIIDGELTGTYLKDKSGECLVCDFDYWSIWYKIHKEDVSC